MRRYPFTVPGLVRLTAGGGPTVVQRLRSGLEPLVMALLHRFDPAASTRAVSSDEMNTLDGPEYPQEWWVRTGFVPADAKDPSQAKERAWLTIEYSRFESEDEWAMQAFFRVAEVEFSLSTNSAADPTTLNLVATHLPAGDIRIVEETLRAHFGGPGMSRLDESKPHTLAM